MVVRPLRICRLPLEPSFSTKATARSRPQRVYSVIISGSDDGSNRTLFFHLGSRRSSQVLGRSASLTSRVLYPMARTNVNTLDHRSARMLSGMADFAGET